VRAAPITALLVAALAVTACGTTAKHEPQALFQQRCGTCHAIAQGGLSPVVAAPNLYDLHPTRTQIVNAVAHGRPGMPRRLVTGDDLERVIDYVLQETAR
jgi:mono/diheme cytochrome c family protein